MLNLTDTPLKSSKEVIREIYDRSKLGGKFKYEDPLDIELTLGDSYDRTELTKGIIYGLNSTGSSGSYEQGCFSKECFLTEGIWTKAITKPVRHITDKSVYEDNCFEQDCFGPFKPLCVKENIEYINKVYDNSCFDEKAWKQSIVKTYIYEEVECGTLDETIEEPIILSPSPFKEALFILGSIPSTKYSTKESLTKDIDLYEDQSCIDFSCFENKQIHLDEDTSLIVSKASPYEPNAFSPECFEETYFVFAYLESQEYKDCVDPCVLDLSIPLIAGSWNNEKFIVDIDFTEESLEDKFLATYQDSQGRRRLRQVAGCIEDNNKSFIVGDTFPLNDSLIDQYSSSECIENGFEKRVFIYDLDKYAYDSNAFSPDCFLPYELIETYPYNPRRREYCSLSQDLNQLKFWAFEVLNRDKELRLVSAAPDCKYVDCDPPPSTTKYINCNSCYGIFNDDEDVYKYTEEGYQFWIEGLVEGDFVYVINLGYIDDFTKEAITVGQYLPLGSDGSFVFDRPLAKGLKFMELIKVGFNSEEKIGITYFGTEEQLTLIRTYGGSLLDLSDTAQYVNLEDLSLTLIKLMLSGYKESSYCSNTEARGYYIEPQLREVIDFNFEVLSTLTDTISNNNRFGSIPVNLTADINRTKLYRPKLLDNSKRLESCFEDTVYQPECDFILDDNYMVGDDFSCAMSCFESQSNFYNQDWEVCNRAIAWLVYALSVYKEVFKVNKYSSLLTTLVDYLLAQKRGNLITQGWTDSDTIHQSEIISEINTDTNSMVVLALLKAYDVLVDPKLLNAALDIWIRIEEDLYDLNNLFYKSLDEDDFTLQANIYGLMAARDLERADIIEPLLKKLKLLSASNQVIDPIIETLDGSQLLDIKGNPVKSSLWLIEDNMNPYYLKNEERRDTYRQNEYDVNGWISKEVTYEKDAIGYPFNININFKDRLKKVFIKQHTSSSITSLLINKFSTHPHFAIKSRSYFNTLLFSRKKTLDSLLKMIPTKFGWFSEKAIKPQGNLYKILKASSRPLSYWSVLTNRITNSRTLSDSESLELDRYSLDLNLPMWEGEINKDYKSRVKKYLYRPFNTLEAIENIFSLYDQQVEIKEKTTLVYNSYKSSLTSELNFIPKMNEFNQLGIPTATIPRIQGEEEGLANKVEIHTFNPVDYVIDQEVEKVKPAGIAIEYHEHLQFTSCDLELEEVIEEGSFNPDEDNIIIIDYDNVHIPNITWEDYCCYSNDICGYKIFNLVLEYSYPKTLYINLIQNRDEEGYALNKLYLSEVPTPNTKEVLHPYEKEKLVIFL